MTDTSLPPSFKAAVDVVRPVVAVSSALIGFTALLVAVGWKTLAAYYAEIGASWVLRTESTPSIVYAGSEHVLPVVVSLLVGFLSFAHGSITSTGLRRVSIAALCIGVLLCAVPPLLPSAPSASTRYVLTIVGTLSISACVGLTVAEIIARYQEQGSKWHPYFVWLFYLSAVYGFFWAPSFAGVARATVDMDVQSTRLPIVELEGKNESNPLRLLATNGDQAVLVQLAAGTSRAGFRVVPLTQIKLIHSTRKAAE